MMLYSILVRIYPSVIPGPPGEFTRQGENWPVENEFGSRLWPNDEIIFSRGIPKH